MKIEQLSLPGLLWETGSALGRVLDIALEAPFVQTLLDALIHPSRELLDLIVASTLGDTISVLNHVAGVAAAQAETGIC